LLNAVALFNVSVLTVGMPYWVAQRASFPPATAAALFSLNTLLVVLLQVRAARRAEDVAGAAGCYRRSGVAFAVACLLFAAVSGGPRWLAVVTLVAAVVALTLGEVSGSAAEWGISLGLAPVENRGRYLALYACGQAAQQAVGPALVTFALVASGRAGWLMIGGGLFGASLLAATISLREARRTCQLGPSPSVAVVDEGF
jgi:hypothetical protein